MRALSAIGFFISVVGLLLVCYDQFGIVSMLNGMESNLQLHSDEYTNNLRLDYEHRLSLNSTVGLIAGVFSVLFCSLLYLRKRTRMTLIGTILGFITATMAIIHSWF